jgi:hypothetical protein
MVIISSSVYRYGQRVLADLPTLDVTDEGGRFDISGLASGDYYVSVSRETLRESGRTYYPGVRDPGLAVRVSASLSPSPVLLELPLIEVDRVDVAGVVLGLDAEARVSAISLLPRSAFGPQAPPLYFPNESNASVGGEFSVSGVPPGDYLLGATVSVGSQRSQDFFTNYVPVLIGREGIETVALTMSEGSVAGRVEGMGDGSSELRVSLEPYYIRPVVIGSPRYEAVGRDAFALSDVPTGRYAIRISVPPEKYVIEALYGSRDVWTEGVVDVASGGQSMAVRLGNDAGRIIGRVAGRSVDGVTVVAVPEDDGGNPARYARTLTDAGGSFSIQSIAPGNYRVYAFDRLPTDAETSSEFMATFRRFGVRVRVDPVGIAISADLQINAAREW